MEFYLRGMTELVACNLASGIVDLCTQFASCVGWCKFMLKAEMSGVQNVLPTTRLELDQIAMEERQGP